MILVVALNPAVDVTYEVEWFQVGRTNRVARTSVRAGGKPLNVARTLGALGVEVTLVGLAADPLPARFADESAALPVRAVWLPVRDDGQPARSRQTVTVVDRVSAEVTGIYEAGPRIDPGAWERLRSEVRSRLAAADALVLSGSLPPGLPVDAYAVLVREARAAGTWVALDTDGRWFGPALSAGPDLVKPNAEELARAGMGEVTTLDEALVAAGNLCRRGTEAAVVSVGGEGLVAATGGESWLARPPRVGGNATGAGDAALAGLVAATVEGLPWTERMRRAAALGAAAVTEPVAGEFQPATYRELLAATEVRSEAI